MALRHTSQIKTPDLSLIKDEATRKVFHEVVRLIYDSFKNIHEDLKNTENILPDPSDGSVADQLRINATKLAYEIFTPGAALQVKVGILTREMDAVSGNVAYTGIGFTPKLILFDYGVDGTAEIYTGMGFDDGTNARATSISATDGTKVFQTNKSIGALEDGSKSQVAEIASFDSDGFTLTWAKGGAPASATLSVNFRVIG